MTIIITELIPTDSLAIDVINNMFTPSFFCVAGCHLILNLRVEGRAGVESGQAVEEETIPMPEFRLRSAGTYTEYCTVNGKENESQV